ncbi:MAG: hypothetical protein Q9201_005375 [Fulgogasparrea decipioides]
MEKPARDSTGRRFEQKLPADARTRDTQAAVKKNAASQRRSSEVRLPQFDPPQSSCESPGNVGGAQRQQGTRRSTDRDIPELDSAPIQRQRRPQQLPLTPPLSAITSKSQHDNQEPAHVLTIQLHTEIQRQQSYIVDLERELTSAKSEGERLRAEKNQRRNEQDQAIYNSEFEEARRLKEQVEYLRQELSESRATEDKLESELDEARLERDAFRRRLQKAESEKMDLEDSIARADANATRCMCPGHTDNDVVPTPTARKPSSSRTTTKYALSVPKGQKKAAGPVNIVKSFLSQ